MIIPEQEGRAVEAILRAIDDVGPVPEAHHIACAKLADTWPSLAGALARLRRLRDLPVPTEWRSLVPPESIQVIRAPGEPQDSREALGSAVHRLGEQWARELPGHVQPLHRVWIRPWASLTRNEKELRMRIGSALFQAGKKAGAEQALLPAVDDGA
jgi:hypothetical protein